MNLVDKVNRLREMAVQSEPCEPTVLVEQLRKPEGGFVDLVFNDDLAKAISILRDKDMILENAHTQADGIIAQARDEVARLVEQTTIVSNARKEATRILAEANADGKKNREEVDQYVDARLATLEVILNKTLDVISKGRDQLGGVETKHALSDLNKQFDGTFNLYL